MNYREVKINDCETIDTITSHHISAYSEKFSSNIISHNRDDYKKETIKDILHHKVVISDDNMAFLVLEDRTDPLIKNSKYHLVKRIFVEKSHRKKGRAKNMIKYCQDKYGALMGYDGKFYMIEEVK